MMIFLTGGTGFVGREVVRQLLAAGNRVRCLVRDADRARRVLPNRVELHTGDLTQPETVARGLKDCEAVIHLVGIIIEKGRNTFERVHVEGTRNLVAAAGEAGISRFVQMSALGSRPNAASRYHQTKFAAEQAVISSGLKWTIFRPSVIFGAGDRFVNRLAQIIRIAPVVPILGDGEGRLQPISVANVGSGFALAVGNPVSHGKTYSLAGPERFRMIEVLQIIMKVLGVEKKMIHIPIGLVRPGASLSEWILPRPPITRDQLIMLLEDNVGDSSDAIHDFSLELNKFESGIKEYLKPLEEE